jgi:lycopene cyclase domain-containing protein
MFGHVTYLFFELAWAVPVIALQWLVGRRRLWSVRWILLLSVVLPTAYLVAADSVAIAQGIWTLHADRIVGVRVGNVPLEEAIFFLLTNSMVAQSVLLVLPWMRTRSTGL